jgi:predicted small metal-binding protein
MSQRRFIDCREYPSEMHCSMLLAADNDDELLDAAVQHAVTIHGHRDSPELRAQLRTLFKTEGRKP